MKLDTEPTFTDSVLFYEVGYYRIGDICASAKGYEQFALMTYRKDGKA
jgi:hypothetical protein